MISTQFIVLSKQPYRESALILYGLSPDVGRLNLVAHGAQKLSAKDFPIADLFRELSVEYEPSKNSELQTPKRLELLNNFDKIADNPRHFKLAMRMGSFLLKNTALEVPIPYTYDAFHSVLSQLGMDGNTPSRWTMEQCSVVLKFTYLYENGLLPPNETQAQETLLEQIIAAGVENSPLPECAPAYWKSLNNWLNLLLDYHQLAR